MTRATIYTRTDKGEQTAASASRELANDLRKVLDAIDGTSSVDALQSRLNFRDAAWLDRALAALVAKELIREAESSEGALDFTSFVPSADSQHKAEEMARHEAAERAKREAEEKVRHEAAEKAKREAEEKARHEAAERAKREAEEKARHEAAERAKREAEEKARREAEEQELKLAAERVRLKAAERARQDAEEQARKAEEQELKLATERVRSKAAEHARKDAEAQAQKLAEEQALREAAERARLDAEAQARKLAEEQTLREAAERARREAEEKAQRMAEELARRDAEEKARREVEEKTRRDAEEKTRRDAEEKTWRDAEEKARRDVEEKARRDAEEIARREAEETARREAEEKARREAAERPRQEVEAQERMAAEEQTWREAEEKFRRGEQEAAAKRSKRATEKEVSVVSVMPSKRAKQLALGITVLLVVGLAAIHLISFDGQIPQFEKSLAAQFQQPVKIQALRLSLVPQRHVRLEGVSIGSEGQIKILQIKAIGPLGNVFNDKKAFSSVELDSPVVTEEGLGWLLFGKPSAGGIAFGPVSVLNATLQSKNVSLPAFDAKLQPGGEGGWQTIAIESADKNLNLELTPKGPSVQIDFKARTFRMPFGSSLVLDELVASGTANRAELAVTEFKAFSYGGILSGNARLKWGAQWNLAGELNAKQVDASRLLPGLVDDARLAGKAAYAMQAGDAGKLFATSRMEGDFLGARGTLLGVDLGRMIGGGAPSSTTRFAEISGVFVHDRGATQLKQVRLSEGALFASGAAEVDANDAVRGRFAIELRMASELRRANVTLGGTLKNLEWRRQ